MVLYDISYHLDRAWFTMSVSVRNDTNLEDTNMGSLFMQTALELHFKAVYIKSKYEVADLAG